MTPPAERWAMGGGIAFVVLFVVAVTVGPSHLPDTTKLHTTAAIDAKVLHAYGQSGTRSALVVGGYLFILSGLALIWFLAGLRSRLERSGESPAVSGLAFTFGTVAAVLIMAGGGIIATIATDLALGGEPAIHTADVARLLPQVGYPLLLLGGMLALAATIAVTTVVALRGSALPRWLGYAGWLGVAGGVFGFAFTPMILVALWVLAVSLTGLLGGPVDRLVGVHPAATIP